MVKYVVIYEGERQDDLAPDLLKGHVEHLRDLHSQGGLFLCGPLKNSSGLCGKGLLIFEANSREEVEGYVLKDPFIAQKWYKSYRIYEWIEANDSNNYLMQS